MVNIVILMNIELVMRYGYLGMTEDTMIEMS